MEFLRQERFSEAAPSFVCSSLQLWWTDEGLLNAGCELPLPWSQPFSCGSFTYGSGRLCVPVACCWLVRGEPCVLSSDVINIDLTNAQRVAEGKSSEFSSCAKHAEASSMFCSAHVLIESVRSVRSKLPPLLFRSLNFTLLSLPLYTEKIESVFCECYCQCLRTQVNKGRETCLLLTSATACSHCCSTWTGKKQDKNPRSNICNCLYPFLSHLFLSDFNDVASGHPLFSPWGFQIAFDFFSFISS